MLTVLPLYNGVEQLFEITVTDSFSKQDAPAVCAPGAVRTGRRAGSDSARHHADDGEHRPGCTLNATLSAREQENHSFDNMLGWLPGVGDLTGNVCCASAPQRASRPCAWHSRAGNEFNLENPADPTSKKWFAGKSAPYGCNPDPNHDFTDTCALSTA